jgi:hypothetical protein
MLSCQVEDSVPSGVDDREDRTPLCENSRHSSAERAASVAERLASPVFQSIVATRSGALFSIQDPMATEPGHYFVNPMWLPEQRLRDAWLHLVGEAADCATDLGSLEKRLGIGRSAILKATNRLMSCGSVCRIRIRYYPGRRFVWLYVLVPSKSEDIARIVTASAWGAQQNRPGLAQ